jgi:hypothetical protein
MSTATTSPRFLLHVVYTPEDPQASRRRNAVVVGNDGGLLPTFGPIEAIALGLSKLEMSGLVGDATSEYLVQSGSDDTSEGYSWVVHTNDGRYDLEWSPFPEADDPVTAEAIRQWAFSQVRVAEDEPLTPEAQVQQILACILGRWFWRNIDGWSAHDLKESLHSMTVEGDDSKPYMKMSIDELLAAILSEVVDNQRDQFDEIANGRAFGMAAMIDGDRALWLEE